VAGGDLEPGRKLAARDLALREVPARYAPAGVLAAPEQLVGYELATPVPRGGVIGRSQLAVGDVVAAPPVEAGERAAEVVGLGAPDLVVAGARVDVLVTRDGDGGAPAGTELALEDVEVLAARRAPAATGPAGARRRGRRRGGAGGGDAPGERARRGLPGGSAVVRAGAAAVAARSRRSGARRAGRRRTGAEVRRPAHTPAGRVDGRSGAAYGLTFDPWSRIRCTISMRFAPDQLEHPIVQAPMAGGASTPALAAAVSEAGGLGFLAAGYKPAAAVRGDVAALRALTGKAFGVNVFAPPQPVPDADAVAAYANRLGADASALRHDDDGWEEKLALLAELRVPVASFAFGCPTRSEVRRLHEADIAVWPSVTTPEEALAARGAGADALVVQGAEAGGHRATFDDERPVDLGLLAALQLIAAALAAEGGVTTAGMGHDDLRGADDRGGPPALPLIATGGIATGRGVAAVLAAGASAAQLGTAFMRCPEAATAPVHREALSTGSPTALTRAFTGRTARGIVNDFMRAHDADAPLGYPDVHHLTAPRRAAAKDRGDPDDLHLWAGQTHVLAQELPAGELVRRLAADARAALRAASARAH
jgi:nitronate monooxygenase